MPAAKLFVKLLAYYAALGAAAWVVLTLFPALGHSLPIGRAQTLVADAGTFKKSAEVTPMPHLRSVPDSLIWLTTAILGSLVVSLPVSRVYLAIRHPKDYDQSLVDTIVMLPVVVTSIVVIVQDSLALSFSLAGIAGAARFRNTMKSSGDLLFVLLAIGIGLAAGIGAMELAFVTSVAFNFGFVALWSSNYGERSDMKRYLSDSHGQARAEATGPPLPGEPSEGMS